MRATEVLAPTDKTCPPLQENMDTFEAKILSILNQHKGRIKAIKAEDLAHISGFSDRVVRKTIAHLVTQHKVPIASSVYYPFGFYILTNKQEAREVFRQYQSRIKNLSQRLSALSKVIEHKFGLKLQKEFLWKNPRPHN